MSWRLVHCCDGRHRQFEPWIDAGRHGWLVQTCAEKSGKEKARSSIIDSAKREKENSVKDVLSGISFVNCSTVLKGGQNWILRPVEKIFLNEKSKLLFIRPKTDNSFSTYRPSKLRPSKFETGAEFCPQ